MNELTKKAEIPVLPINKTQKRLYAASSDSTFEHEDLASMKEYLNNPTAYFGQLLYCKATDTHYRIAQDGQGGKELREIGSSTGVSSDNFKILNSVQDRDELTEVGNGVICYVVEDGVYYTRKNDEWELFSGSGGGGSSIGSLTSSLDQKILSISTEETLAIDLFFSTPNVGAGQLHVLSNESEILTQAITMGNNKISIDLPKGEHKLKIYVVDRGGVYTNNILITVNCGGLDISTTFNDKKDYNVGSTIAFPYKIETISKEPITTYFIINGQTYEETSQEGHNDYIFPDLGAGTHKVEVYSKSGEFESNRIKFTLVMLNSDSLYISSLFDKKEAEEGDQLIIDYRVSMSGVKEFNVEYYVDDDFIRKGKAYNGSNTFPISNLEVGDKKIKIKVSTIDELYTKELIINIKIVESSYQMQKHVTQGLVAWFDAYELTNQNLERNIWRDKIGKYTGELYNFNYNSNGWIKNGLKMNGSAYAKLNVQPFLTNAETGLTIDIEFQTEDVGNENARVFDCTTRLASALGCYVDTNEALITSNANTVKSPFAQNERTRVTYIIDRINKLTKIYINAVLSEVAFLTDIGIGNEEVLEKFGHEEYIYLNSQKGESNFGDCTIYGVRVYNRALTSDEVLQNHIADIKDKAEQKKKYDFNHNNTIPTMYFYGDVSAMTKENRVPLRIKYISTNDKLYGSSFDLEECEVQWQGTSSIQYAIKNYKIRLKGEKGEDGKREKFKRPLREGMIPEDKFVLKADYMESSHANNTGLAKMVNRYLYEEKLPPQKKNDKVVSAIDGFPIKLYINDKLMGVFNFNLDKGNDKSFGFDKKLFPECVSYEISANTDTTAGAFNKWTGKQNGEEELAYLQKDFELRYPDEKEDPTYGYLTKLKRLVDWVSDADDATFKKDFELYFNKEYTLKYYLFVLTFGMVDNLGKNMMINTWDGKIWFPCFYDLDTCLALDNSGYVRFDVDLEVESGSYNTSSSKLWSKVARVFDSELKDMYKKMRAKDFKEANIFKVLIEEQVDQIPEKLYNLDSQQKYIAFGKSYIHMLHGSRREHMRKWITERLLYLDSKLGYEEHTKESITVRANKEGEVYFDIKTYSPMYIKVEWRNGEEEIKKVGRNKTVRFSYEIPTATDQEIFIYGAKHLKEIGDISHMSPTSLSLANASRLTKLVCTNNDNLQALGIGGVADGVSYNLKNLQLLDLTNCSNLGAASGNNVLDVAYCDNLKVLRVQGTALQNVTFNPKGGNLEEIYMSNSVTSLYLTNQYNLRKVEFAGHSYSDTLEHRAAYDEGSQIANLTIIDCPNLTLLGLDRETRPIAYGSVCNYRETLLEEQAEDFDITKEEYNQAFTLSSFGRLESVNITNSLLNYKYYNVNASPNLTTLSFSNMPKLKGLILTGNRTYKANGGNAHFNIEGEPMFKGIELENCKEFDTLIIQRAVKNRFAQAYKFKKDYVLDLSKLPLKKFVCNMSLQNLKKIILPDTIEEFSHSYTVLQDHLETAPDGSTNQYKKDDSPLETIVIDKHYSEDFVGIDFNNVPLKNVNLGGLVKKVKTIKNIKCEAIDLNPAICSEHFINLNNPKENVMQELENIEINLDNYKGKSLARLFIGADITKFNVILTKNLTTEGMDFSYMFNQTRNVEWSNIESFISKMPKGTVFRTFERCDVERLEVGHMIGSSTTNMSNCFASMPKIVEINIENAETSNVTAFNGTFRDNPKLTQIIGVENLIHEKCDDLRYLFMNTQKLKFSFLNGKPNWKLEEGKKLQNTKSWLLNCGEKVSLDEGEKYILDLREFGTLGGNIDNGFVNERYMGFTHFYADGWDYTGTGTTSHKYYANYAENPNLVELHLTNFKLASFDGGLVHNNPKLETLNLQGTDASEYTGEEYEGFNSAFANNPKLKHVTFLTNIKVGFDISASTLLTEDSLVSILEGLADLKGSQQQIVKLGEANLKKLSDTQKQIAIKKNWALAE